jgi:hypothetical protein
MKKAGKDKILNHIVLTLKCQIKTLIKLKKRHQAPPRETLSPSRENGASWSKTLALLGLLQPATHANTAQSASQDVHKAG